VVIGGDDDLDRILESFDPGFWTGARTPAVADILAMADQLRFPESIRQLHTEEREKLARWLADPARQVEREAARQKAREQIESLPVDTPEQRALRDRALAQASAPPPDAMSTYPEPKIGEWPAEPPGSSGLSVAFETKFDGDFTRARSEPREKVNIVLIPTDDWTTAPAHIRWGGWNECPPPEHHVAAFRSWRDRYGAELVGMSFDVLNIRVARKPASREEALALARVQYDYCSDIVDQGVGTLSSLAAALMANDWWFFWWD
jgi:hypothetical protein